MDIKQVTKIFDTAVQALGLMTNKIANSINGQTTDSRFRDECAIKAMQGIISAQTEMRTNNGCYTADGSICGSRNPEYLAKESYLIADAMLKARKEANNDNR